MTQAFLSYARPDQAFADRLAAALPPLGIEPWIDRAGIHGGAKWSTAIQTALDAADVLVLVLSPAAMASSNVEDEWQYALDRGTPVLPVLLEPTKVHFQLGRIQYTDFRGQPFEAALAQLAESVGRALVAAAESVTVQGPSQSDGEDAAAAAPGDEARARAAHAAEAIGPPSGTVTFLFTDIEGSTQRWDEQPDAMRAALERHDALLRRAVTAAGGHVFKTIGDAFCAAFATAGAGLAAAIEAQRSVTAEDWSVFGEGFGPLRVRMGLHTGEATERGGDYFGQPVNRVARLEAAGYGGQVLLSGVTATLVREHLAEDARLRDWGEHRLKDLRHSEHIVQILTPGMPEVDTPPRTAEALHPRDFVRVVDRQAGEGPSDTDSARARLEAAVTGDGGLTATLTSAEATALARHKPADWRTYRLGRIAEWSQARYRLDGRFVGLTLLIDQGEETATDRWAATEERHTDLAELLSRTEHPAVVVLGPPGGGKSTLLRRLELDTAIGALRGEGDDRITLLVSLNTYKPARPGEALPAPADWLAERWSARCPDLPSLEALLAEGRVTLLLDALNEMPAASEADFHGRVRLWKDWLIGLAGEHAGNRVVFSCRSLDYSQSLSTPDLRVPQVRIEPLTDAQVADFLALYSPGHHRRIWSALKGSPQLEVLRSPYFLVLLVEQVEATGEMPTGRVGLFTGFVRQALRREIERGNALFEPGLLLAGRDLKQVAKWRWKGAYDLPERGVLVPQLAALAHAMQSSRADGEASQVRVDVDDALDMLDSKTDEAILAAGAALAVLDEDEAAGELMYVHQLVQEYFAARQLARSPDPERVRAAWRAAEIQPSVEALIDTLGAADPLPPRSGTGWEETTLLAAAMAPDPDAFVRGIMEANLPLAGRVAAQPDVRPRLADELLDELRGTLAACAEDARADLRARIACGHAVGALGDPRFERRLGPHGTYHMPPLVSVGAGTYEIGDDDPIAWGHPTGGSGVSSAHIPRHRVALERFEIGRFPVTNAEWACFMAADGYEDERWWPTREARRWLCGEMPNVAAMSNNRVWRTRLREDEGQFQRMVEHGVFVTQETQERMARWLAMEDADFEIELAEHWKGKRSRAPEFWADDRFHRPSQPVVGVSWYEALAYCSWLSAQCGRSMRLPSEVEWEAAARGTEGRRYPGGTTFGPTSDNTRATHLRTTSPVGVFPGGATPEGVCDLGGNVRNWTRSVWGADADQERYAYPYDPTDAGREDLDAGRDLARVVRGGSWRGDLRGSHPAFRTGRDPVNRYQTLGFRVMART